MAYRVNVVTQKVWADAYQNLVNECWISDSPVVNMGDALAECYCTNITDSPYIEFRSEKDAMLFLLRCS